MPSSRGQHEPGTAGEGLQGEERKGAGSHTRSGPGTVLGHHIRFPHPHTVLGDGGTISTL